MVRRCDAKSWALEVPPGHQNQRVMHRSAAINATIQQDAPVMTASSRCAEARAVPEVTAGRMGMQDGAWRGVRVLGGRGMLNGLSVVFW